MDTTIDELIFVQAQLRAYLGDTIEVPSYVAQIRRLNPGSIYTTLGDLLKYAIRGMADSARACLTSSVLPLLSTDGLYSQYVASFLSRAGAKKEALDWLENAVNRGFINYPYLAEKDPFLANIRGEERFKKLMVRVKDEWEHCEL